MEKHSHAREANFAADMVSVEGALLDEGTCANEEYNVLPSFITRLSLRVIF